MPSADGDYPSAWRWKIRRYSKPMGMKISGGGYKSKGSAEFAGKPPEP